MARARGIKVVGLLVDLIQVNPQVQLFIEKILGYALFTFILEDTADFNALVELMQELNCSNSYSVKVLSQINQL